MYILVKKSFKGDMFQLRPKGTEDIPKWFFLDTTVKTFAKTIEPNTELDVKTELRGQETYITYITLAGHDESPAIQKGATVATGKCIKCGATVKDSKFKTCWPCGQKAKEAKEQAGDTPSKYTCVKCGAGLKDDKYKTCYTCSMEIRKQTENSPEELSRNDIIKRQAIGHMVSRTLIGLLQTKTFENVTAEQLDELITNLYAKYVEVVG